MKTYRMSALVTYERCPHCFYLEYVVNAKKAENDNLEIGTQTHKMIEEYHKGGRYVAEHPVARALFREYRKFYTNPKHYDELEQVLRYQLVHPITGEELPYILKGTLDKQYNGRLEDHKTSASRWKQDDLENHLQIHGYAYLFWRHYGKLPDGMRINVLVKTARPYLQPLDTYVTIDNLALWFERIKRILKNIEAGKFEASKHWLHNYDLCPGKRSRKK